MLTPTKRPWLDKYRAELAKSFGCKPSEVEGCIEASKKMDAYIAERMEREGHPFRSRVVR